MLIDSTENKLVALLMALLLCRFSCTETSNAYDASKVETATKSNVGDEEAVEDTKAPLSSERPDGMFTLCV